MSALEGGRASHQQNVQCIPFEDPQLEKKNHQPGKQFRILNYYGINECKMAILAILLEEIASNLVHFVICVTTFHWSFKNFWDLSNQTTIFYFSLLILSSSTSRDIQEGKNLKTTSHQQLRIFQDGTDAAQEDNAHCATTTILNTPSGKRSFLKFLFST